MSSLQLLRRIVADTEADYALIHRPDALGPGKMDVLVGESREAATLSEIPLRDEPSSNLHDALVLVPHQQIRERGFAATVDNSPLLVMSVLEESQVSLADALDLLPNDKLHLSNGHFDIPDAEYAALVHDVLTAEIATGEGSNFVIKRSFVADIDYSSSSALSLFRRLLTRESGAYWTFLVRVAGRTFVGATPERHVSLREGVAAMTPISGTYRYPPSGPSLSELVAFLGDAKERDELYMVLDEELKMMARICRGGGRVKGPFLREMAWLAHTEYTIEGPSDLDPRSILRETMFAPTVTGSPVENACRVISRYEPQGRGYYGGIVALIGRGKAEQRLLDSAILIRTAELSPASGGRARVQVGVGATLVRNSDPGSEVKETLSKAAGVLTALDGGEQLAQHPDVLDALAQRNRAIAQFWLSDERSTPLCSPALNGKSALVIDAEDTFSWMLAHQLRALGLAVTVARFDENYSLDGYDLVVLGPGPGDPRDSSHPRMAHLGSVSEDLVSRQVPFLAVCLSHQVLCQQLGLEVRRRDVPNQGTQNEVDLFGSQERVGFYNSFEACADAHEIDHPIAGTVRVSFNPETGEVHALRGATFRSVQFHLESVLTRDAERILTDMIGDLMIETEGAGVQ